jgi:hypothetical protein
MGNVPEWLGTLGVSAQLFLGIQGRRREWALDFSALLEELGERDDDEIRRLVSSNPAIAQLVGDAWEEAAKTAAEEKRWLLAHVAVAAMSSTDDAAIRELPFFLRTIVALEPPHVRLLVLIGTPRPGQGQLARTRLEGYVGPEEIREVWPEVSDLLEPMIALLQREALIDNRGAGSFNAVVAWGVTRYGRRFLQFLPDDDDWTQNRECAEVVSRLDEGGHLLVIRNLGPGFARDVKLYPRPLPNGATMLSDYRDAAQPPRTLELGELAPEIEVNFPVFPPSVGAHVITVEWCDSRGLRERTEELPLPS